MTHEEFTQAAEYWKRKAEGSRKMERAPLLAAIEAYLAANNTCALATGAGDFVRCTPIEYVWREGCFWLFSEGGEKFVGLESNPNVSLAVFDKFEGFGKLHGLQVMGTAEIIEPFSERYNAAAAARGIPLDALRKMQPPMHLICVRPARMDFTCSDFKPQGYDMRQSLTLE